MSRTNIKPKQTCQSLSHFFELMTILVKQQNNLQSYKQIITQRADFNPQALFNYLTKGDSLITRRHIIQLFQENELSCNQEEIKTIFASYGYKQGLDFSAFLNYLYPVSVQCLKFISQERVKKYSKLQSKINQEILCLFLLLIQQELHFFKKYQISKIELLPKINRKAIKKLVRSIKKEGQCKYQFEIETQNIVTYEEFKLTVKNIQKEKIKAKNSQKIILGFQRNLPSIFRRLSMGKNNIVTLEQLQFWLRPSNTFKTEEETLSTLKLQQHIKQDISCYS